ncbi:MAG TPA: hypothetical protein VM784_07645 [Actinomycetota bacterium]|nr:hypothetical protein [Actinomycetota bacterium]
MWADSRWIAAPDGWLEARATAAGALDRLELLEPGLPPAGASRFEGVFSVVVNDRSKKLRRLPTLYFKKAPVFTGRDDIEVVRMTTSVAQTVMRSVTSPTYLVTACEIHRRLGLYARDVHNRSSYRLKLARVGGRFSENPFVTFAGKGTFECHEWGAFSPEFVVLGLPAPDDVVRTTGALLVFLIATRRIRKLSSSELHELVGALGTLEALSADDPELLATTIGG